MNKPFLSLATLAVCAFVASSLLATQAEASFVRAGAKLNYGVSGATDIEESTVTGNDTLTGKANRDNDGSVGVNVYGLVGILDGVDVGLSLNYFSSFDVRDSDDNIFAIGNETDLNLRASYLLPIPLVHVSVHGDAGISLFSLDSKAGQAEGDENLRLFRPTDPFDKDNTSSFGFNAGGGIQVGYSLLPLMSLVVGLDYQYYSIQAFSGENSSVADDFSAKELTVDLTGNRILLSFGLEFAL